MFLVKCPMLALPGFWNRGREADTTGAPVRPISCRLYLLSSPEAFFSISFRTVNSPMICFKSSGDSPGSYPWDWGISLGIAFIMENARRIGLKLFSPAVNHGAGDPKFLTHFFLCGVTLHAFQHDLQFELRRITLPFVVHSIQYLSLLLC
jgi:hypothetical protein